MVLLEIEYGNQGNLYIKKDDANIYIKEINASKNPFSENNNTKKISYKNRDDFYLPLGSFSISFLAANGTGKTLIAKTIHNFFLTYDKTVSKQAQQTEFIDNDNFSIINKYIILHTKFQTESNIKNLYLFSLNNIYSHQYDYLILPNLEYVFKKFNLVRIFNDYIHNTNNYDFIEIFYDALSTNLENRSFTLQKEANILIKENLIFDEIKEQNTVSLLIYLVERLAIENNLSVSLTIDKIINNDQALSWQVLNKFLNNTPQVIANNLDIKILLQFLLSFTTKNILLKDLIIESIEYFKQKNPFYQLFKKDFSDFSQFIKSQLKNDIVIIDNNKEIKLIKHYCDIFETTLFYPLSIKSDNEINLNTFIDSYDRYDKYSARSVFSLIEKNGSEYEKINYKNICTIIFLRYLKTIINLSNDNNRILILSDDIFSQTDNHNALINLLEFQNEIYNQKLENITTWLNLTHSFSAFQIFNKSLNVDYNDMFLIKKQNDKIQVESLKIKNKFFVEYLNNQIKKTNIKNEEKIISIFTKIIYDRFLFEQLPNQKTQENILTNFLHYFSKDLNQFTIDNSSALPSYIKILINLMEKESQGIISYKALFTIMNNAFSKNPLEYKNLNDIEICFFYSIYLRFLIENFIFNHLKLNDKQINENLNFTGNLIDLIKEKNINIYNEIIGLYNLAKNYIHYDYISYEYIIFVNPVDYKNKILKLKNFFELYDL